MSPSRDGNLLGAVAVTAGDRAGAAIAAAEDLSPTQAAALIRLDNYAAGAPLMTLSEAWHSRTRPRAGASAGGAERP